MLTNVHDKTSNECPHDSIAFVKKPDIPAHTAVKNLVGEWPP